ncbi:hth-like domain [Desulfoluna spongiiphila]|nr:hth-like domain [Desulfoluna spongiiphila]VVS93992.1 hth-like domain [Desulfoluna spongiiphila]VVS95285.1 hth-like domain [Desulfoluna spongiiphila]
MKAFPVAILCRVMGASRSGFYDYLKRLATPPDLRKKELEDDTKKFFLESKQAYGSRRILEELLKKGYQIGREKVRNLMKKLGLKPKLSKKYRITTNSNHKYPVAKNLLDRQFNPPGPNQVWATDITYIWTLEGWAYLAIVMDLYSRQIVGWNIGARMTKRLVLDALDMAWWRRQPTSGLLHHSDRGSQYACKKYQEQLDKYQMVCSMSRKGNCWDNAPVERFFRSLKSERLSFCRFETRNQARLEVLDYIAWYNSSRLHSTLGYVSPMEFEAEPLKIAA